MLAWFRYVQGSSTRVRIIIIIKENIIGESKHTVDIVDFDIVVDQCPPPDDAPMLLRPS